MKLPFVSHRYLVSVSLLTALACGPSGEGATARAKVASKTVDGAKAGAKAGDRAKPTVPAEPKSLVDTAAPTTSKLDPSIYYWAQHMEGKAVIDIIDPLGSSPDGDPVMALAHEHDDEPDGFEVSIPRTATLPAGFAWGDEWVVVGVDTVHRGKAAAFGAMTGLENSILRVVLDVDGAGLAVRASAWKEGSPRLRKAEPLDLRRGPGKALLGALTPGLTGLGEAKAKAAMGRHGLSAEHVQIVEGRFTDGFTHLVTIMLPLRPGEVGADHVAGMVLADASGRVESVYPTQLTIEIYTIRYLVDLDGDGQDEVIWNNHYFEGDFMELLAWDGAGTRVGRTLTGDGA